VAAREPDLENLRNLSAKHATRLLGGLRGVGPWTIDYVFLRGLGFPDSLPSGDAGIAQALQRLTGERPADKEIRALAERFAPYRSFAAAHLWASLHQEKP
jgi:DNA-3-methyladenine glycosylase II